MATSSDGPAGLGSLLGFGSRRRVSEDGCWPSPGPDRQDRPVLPEPKSPEPGRGRGCWPDSDDLNRGDISPADAIRKIVRRARWI
jgi:hypothetical protein